MKKTLLLTLFLSVFLVLPLASCNEESDHSADKRLASELPGTWVLSDTQSDEDGNKILSRNVMFVFTSKRTFDVSTVRTTPSKTTSYSVRGTWSIKNEVLQLRYELNSLITMGLTTQEITALKTSLNSNNEMLDDLKDNAQSYGMPIEISRKDAFNGMMKLTKNSDFAGLYTLSDYGDSPE